MKAVEFFTSWHARKRNAVVVQRYVGYLIFEMYIFIVSG